jgi:hypothetical protein
MDKNQFNKLLIQKPKFTKTHPHSKGRGGNGGRGRERRGRGGGKEREHSPNKVLRLQHWKYPFAPMVPLTLGLTAYNSLHSPIVCMIATYNTLS